METLSPRPNHVPYSGNIVPQLISTYRSKATTGVKRVAIFGSFFQTGTTDYCKIGPLVLAYAEFSGALVHTPICYTWG